MNGHLEILLWCHPHLPDDVEQESPPPKGSSLQLCAGKGQAYREVCEKALPSSLGRPRVTNAKGHQKPVSRSRGIIQNGAWRVCWRARGRARAHRKSQVKDGSWGGAWRGARHSVPTGPGPQLDVVQVGAGSRKRQAEDKTVTSDKAEFRSKGNK